MSRTRSRSSTYTSGRSRRITYINNGTSTTQLNDYVTTTSTMASETIVDELGFWTQSTRKPCTHQKLELTTKSGILIGATWRVNSVSWHVCDTQTAFVGQAVRPLTFTGFTFPGPSASEVNSAFRGFTDHVPRTFSLANFLLELDQLPMLLSDLARRAMFLKSATNSRSVKKARRQGDYLEFNFGINPFIEDLKKAFSTLEYVKKRIAFLKRTYGKKVTVRKRLKASFSNPPNYPASLSGSVPYKLLELGTKYIGQVSQQIFNETSGYHVVGCQMYQRLSGLDDVASVVSGLLSASGFNRPLSIGWEALPFSWIADYALNVSQVLDQFKSADAFVGEIYLSNGWTSTKATTTFDVIGHINRSPSTSSLMESRGGTGHIIASGKVTYYKRSVGISTSSGVYLRPTDSPMTLSQYNNILNALPY